MISHIDIGYNGRLGNQIFIYSTLFKLKTLNKEVSIPKKNSQLKIDGCLDQFHKKWINYKYVMPEYFDLSIPEIDNVPNEIWTEPKQGFHPEVFDLDNVSLRGYFQSWKYFDDIKLELLKELSFKQDIKEKVNKIYKKYNNKKTVCIHIRLGDTLAQSWMHKLSPEYIQKCFTYLPNEDYNFLIFSDNIDYCKNWFPQDESVYFANDLNEAESLYMMSLCNHFIMSGSTFSWWGAYLGQKEDSVILFPNHFDGTDRILNDFYHPSWKRINI
jgi:hypothetical protein